MRREVDARWFARRPRGRGTEAHGRRPTHESAGVLPQRRFRSRGDVHQVLEAKPSGIEVEACEEVLIVGRLSCALHRPVSKATSLDLALGLSIQYRSTQETGVFDAGCAELSLGGDYGVDEVVKRPRGKGLAKPYGYCSP